MMSGGKLAGTGVLLIGGGIFLVCLAVVGVIALPFLGCGACCGLSMFTANEMEKQRDEVTDTATTFIEAKLGEGYEVTNVSNTSLTLSNEDFDAEACYVVTGDGVKESESIKWKALYSFDQKLMAYKIGDDELVIESPGLNFEEGIKLEFDEDEPSDQD